MPVMLPQKIHLEIVTPERRVLARDVDEVVLPGALGSFGVLPGHAPMLAGLAPGVAQVRTGARQEILAIGRGFAEVQPNRVTVMAESAERLEEIDLERARQKVAEVEQAMLGEHAQGELEALHLRLQKHQARLVAAQRSSS
ncbi:MAG: F0F1 ATP synthase subunit epsilon [Acidobacteria bacterium]|nr:F0F1 ATP synthase subunit epsilon [Acidobacteriota bacterium]